MLALKAFHVMAMVTWFAGLFYLPRLFVYHADTEDHAGRERFKLMEKKLLIMSHIGMGLTFVLGGTLAWEYGLAWFKASHWFHAKLLLVFGLLAYQIVCGRMVRTFAADANTRGHRFYRLFNEIPALFLVAIVYLAVVKPF
ncbi:MAG: CopD family protein [Gammaproteobacteria bacterium]|nr:CopD family protein [Gammaproteobacteria bacterium]